MYEKIRHKCRAESGFGGAEGIRSPERYGTIRSDLDAIKLQDYVPLLQVFGCVSNRHDVPYNHTLPGGGELADLSFNVSHFTYLVSTVLREDLACRLSTIDLRVDMTVGVAGNRCFYKMSQGCRNSC